MKKPFKEGDINRKAARGNELIRCKLSAKKQAENSGAMVYIPHTRCHVLIKTGQNKQAVIDRHIKNYDAQRIKIK